MYRHIFVVEDEDDDGHEAGKDKHHREEVSHVAEVDKDRMLLLYLW